MVVKVLVIVMVVLIYAIGICKDWGWGGCKGQSLIHYV